ncbi:hypothetical protein ANI02nite_33360 [Acetobacter nitrogenifigens DSM 23921 = NBRC 105050]|uniref:Uncharacterized protein n=1 Tax=Acetobacter nitrogenifigens DSM 23921 = NBRC 105050 TaxID=1120919 RepID=A0A511XER3_9PROT|nr:hypothetical protein ANI02nite_33360 [Acetobacter nitrogenifigens DSM 23921 = NBRC 105050]
MDFEAFRRDLDKTQAYSDRSEGEQPVFTFKTPMIRRLCHISCSACKTGVTSKVSLRFHLIGSIRGGVSTKLYP